MSVPDNSGATGPLLPLDESAIVIPPPHDPTSWVSKPGKRLFWTLSGPLGSSVFILPEDLNPDGPREPYDVQGDLHAISQEPITEQPVTFLKVEEEFLFDWANEWYTINQEGFDEGEEPDPEDVPPEFEPLVVTASGAKDFITIHDFLSAVHPWLMGLRPQILRARNVADEYYEPDVVNTRLAVQATRPRELRVVDEEEQLANLRYLRELRSSAQGSTA